MPNTDSAETVVIGGGVVGASVAYHLARLGCADVLVLDRGAGPGEGSTGRATGGFRAQFGSAVNVRLSLLARDKLRTFRDETGVDPGYRPCGYLFLAGSEAERDALLAAQAVQRAAGLDEAVALTPDEAHGINPAVSLQGVVGAVHCPTDGFIRPLEILRGYREAAERLGVRFRYGTACTGMRRVDGRIVAVEAERGAIGAARVVNAAGAWAGVVARCASVDLPVTPLRRQVAMTVPCTLLPDDMPLTIFVGDGFHLRVRDGRVLLCWPDEPSSADPWDTGVQPEWLAEVSRRARARVPCLADVPIDPAACWAGLYEMSPDRHAILGVAPEVENLYLANGSSGHGVMHAPALGQLLAEMIVEGRARSLDVAALRPGRFAEGAAHPAVELL